VVDMTVIVVTSFFVTTDLVSFSRALADPTRWRIIRLLAERPLCVCELADILAMPQSSVSSQVQIIRKPGLLEEEKRGKWIYYRILPKFRRLLRDLEAAFPPADPQVFLDDAARCEARLEKRESSCCPRPEKLLSRRAKS
jgi:ArsR family transcriptional regulator, arsenate/arsenite/antimonite-responsive transcriptional repressor